jgi:hypothetical protein
MSLAALKNRVRKLEQEQKAQRQKIKMVGGTTQSECESATIASYINDSGMTTYCSQASLDERIRAQKAASKADPRAETIEERAARLRAEAGKPYYRR